MKRSAIILFLLSLISCELMVDIQVPFPKAQLTLNSFFNADSLWVASLTENQSILDTLPRKRVENGVVIIYQNDMPIDTLRHVVNGVYRSDKSKPVPGQAYEIRAMAAGYQPVRGRSHIPLSAPITDVDLLEGTRADGFPETTVRITFNDDSNAENFYQVFIEREFDVIDESGEVRVASQRLSFDSDDPIVQNNGDIGYDGLFMKDIFFSGGKAVVSFKVVGWDGPNFEYSIITLRTLSADFYEYKITGQLQENTSDNPFAQPVNVYDNIDDGFGIFAGYSEHRYSVGEVPLRPVIHSISPAQGKRGDHIIIKGENLWDSSSFGASVSFRDGSNVAYANVVNGTPTELDVVIPLNASTGKIYVGNNSKIGVSDEVFIVE